YPIPFAKAAYDKVLDLETMLRNSLLYDKTLTGLAANKLTMPDPKAPDPANPDMIPVFGDAQHLATTLTYISSGAIHPTWKTSTLCCRPTSQHKASAGS